MPLFTIINDPLPASEIHEILVNLRNKADAPFSHYHASAIAEFRMGEKYFYTPGVNIENPAHNRLSLHAEQSAIANGTLVFGNRSAFSTLWVMAAPADAKEDHSAGMPCGHCRQIMVSRAASGAKIYPVELNGKFHSSSFDTDGGLLPEAFSEGDVLEFDSGTPHDAYMTLEDRINHLNNLAHSQDLEPDQISRIMDSLHPYVVSENFRTSPISACIIKCRGKGYAAGVLMQDVAFLTTDAIYTGMNNAITRFGKEELIFDEIHLSCINCQMDVFSFAEIQTLRHYQCALQSKIFVHHEGKVAEFTFQECIEAAAAKIGIHPHIMTGKRQSGRAVLSLFPCMSNGTDPHPA